jgi:hypothetical protein
VTEAEWLASDDPLSLLAQLPRVRMASDRKLRLVACGCCRRLGEMLGDDWGPWAVELSERYADGRATDAQLAGVNRDLSDHLMEFGDEAFRAVEKVTWTDAAVARFPVPARVSWLAYIASWASAAASYRDEIRTRQVFSRKEWAAQGQLLRDVLGPLPFRRVAADAAWRRWNNGTVPSVARHVYDARAWHDLPILADALMDAGCGNEEIIAHCRNAGPHVRGCWVVDLILCKA